MANGVEFYCEPPLESTSPLDTCSDSAQPAPLLKKQPSEIESTESVPVPHKASDHEWSVPNGLHFVKCR